MAANNYVLKVTLRGIDDPVVTRTLSVPKTITFYTFHDALQIAFGWCSGANYASPDASPDSSSDAAADTPPYQFDVLELEPQMSTSAPRPGRLRESRTKGSLQDSTPDSWTLIKSTERLEEVLDVAGDQYAGSPVVYIYHPNYSHPWEHTIEKVGLEVRNGVIKCVAGEGRSVVEDCGGIADWKNLKSIYRAALDQLREVDGMDDGESHLRVPTTTGEKDTWRRYTQLHGDDVWALDPDEWSEDDVNAQLEKLLVNHG